jgi:hypothetical protein
MAFLFDCVEHSPDMVDFDRNGPMALVSQWQATEHFCPFGDLHVNL